MQRIYLLLRNNNEYGPYTIGELMQQQLRPSDLVWVEGQSQAWCYPYEIPELKASISSNATHEKKKTRRMIDAEEELERQAEALRQRVMNSHLHHYNSRTNKSKEHTAHFEPLPFAEGAISFVDHRHDKRWPVGEWISAVMVVVVVGAGIYGGRIIMNSSRWIASATTRLESSSSHAAAAKKPGTPAYTAPRTIQAVDTTQATQSIVMDSIAREDSLARLIAYKHKKPVSTTPKEDTVTDIAQANTAAPAVIKHEETASLQATIQKNNDETEKKDPLTTAAKDNKESKGAKDKGETVTAEEQEHKTLGQVIKGIFKKKKKVDKQADDTTSNAGTGN
jgi:hypothetical protein